MKMTQHSYVYSAVLDLSDGRTAFVSGAAHGEAMVLSADLRAGLVENLALPAGTTVTVSRFNWSRLPVVQDVLSAEGVPEKHDRTPDGQDAPALGHVPSQPDHWDRDMGHQDI